MRILALTAGAANMYCGSCLRDNALAREMMRLGHDVTLVPMYTPTRTDSENVSGSQVFFGGINIYLQQRWSLFRALPRWLDRWLDSNWLLRRAASGSVSVDPRQLGELTVSTLKGERGFQKKEIERLIAWLKTEPRPDVIALPYTLLIGLAEPLKRALDAPVVCALQGEDLFLDGLEEPWQSECLDLIRLHTQHVDRFIAVSAYYAGFMSKYLGIERSRIEIAPIGIDAAPFEPVPKGDSGPLRIGYFARVCPEKGLHVLCEAAKRMSEPHELHVAGYLPPEHAEWLSELEREFGFKYEGSPDMGGKVRFLQSVDVLSVPSLYAEPKGFFVLEAMACGTPVVQPKHGAYPEIISKARGGLLVEPGCHADLSSTLDSLARDRPKLLELGRAGAEGVRQHYTLRQMAERTVEIYKAHAASTSAG